MAAKIAVFSINRVHEIGRTRASAPGVPPTRLAAWIEHRSGTWRSPRVPAVDIGLRVAGRFNVVGAKALVTNKRLHAFAAGVNLRARLHARTVGAAYCAALREPHAGLPDVAVRGAVRALAPTALAVGTLALPILFRTAALHRSAAAKPWIG